MQHLAHYLGTAVTGLVMVLLGAAAPVARAQEDECSTDADCPTYRLCESQARNGDDGPTTQMRCVGNWQITCIEDTRCGDGFACSEDGRCYATTTSCELDDDCPDDWGCLLIWGQCADPRDCEEPPSGCVPPDVLELTREDASGHAERLAAGSVGPGAECSTDADCPAYRVCDPVPHTTVDGVVDVNLCRGNWQINCVNDAQCGDGFECQAWGDCWSLARSCEGDQDCPADWVCRYVSVNCTSGEPADCPRSDQCVPPGLTDVPTADLDAEPSAPNETGGQSGSTQSGCSVSQPAVGSSRSRASWLLLGMGLLAVTVRLRRSRRWSQGAQAHLPYVAQRSQSARI